MTREFIIDSLKLWDLAYHDNGDSFALYTGGYLALVNVSDVKKMLLEAPKAQWVKSFDRMIATLNWNKVCIEPEWARTWEQMTMEEVKCGMTHQ